MKETKQKSLVLIITTIALFVVAIIGATYAYFATTTRIDANIGVNIETAGTSYTFTASSDSQEINMSITAVDMAEANVSTEKIKNGIGNIDISLSSPSDDIATTCTYDIIWVWDSSDIYEGPETIIGTLPYIKDEVTYPYEFSIKIDNANETDLSNLDAGITPNSIILQRGASIVSHSTTATEKKHTVEASIYNLPIDQEKLKNKSFKAHITIENLNCTMSESLKPKYWNDDFEYTADYSFPNTPDTTYSSLEDLKSGYSNFTSRPYYIKTTDKEHLVCLNYNNNEFCFGANYWNTDDATTEEKLQTEMAAALGISEGDLGCASRSDRAACFVDDFACGVYSGGGVNCGATHYACSVSADGYAFCDEY